MPNAFSTNEDVVFGVIVFLHPAARMSSAHTRGSKHEGLEVPRCVTFSVNVTERYDIGGSPENQRTFGRVAVQ